MFTREMRNSRMIWPILTAMMTIVLSTSLGIGVQRAYAHGDSVLTVTPDAVAPGETFTVKAEGVEAGEIFRISLLGLSYEVILGDVTVGDDEDFHQDFVVPNEAPPALYQIEAVSEEGESLVAELTVLGGATSESPRGEDHQPSGENAQLERTRTIGQWLAISAVVLTSIGLGVFLIHGAKSAEIDE